MFRKKKNMGSVTVFEDDDPPPRPDEFADLGLQPHADNTDIDRMTAQQLETLALSTANQGKESTSRALRLAVEAREVGVSTAEKMQSQTTQLEKMSDDIEVVHDYLDKSERLIDKMSKPKIVRMFQRKKPVGKGLEKVKASKKETEARVEMREKGVSALDVATMRGGEGVISMDALENDREQLLDGETVTDVRRGLGRRKKKEPERNLDPRQIREDYSQYSQPVADVMKKQDDDLDQIADALADMRSLAGAMNSELQYQETLIEEVQGFTAETSRRTKENAKKINRIK